MIKIKLEDSDSLSDTDSSHISMNPTTPSEKSSGEKGRYECEDCHEMFAVKRELATHMRIHSGEQPHSCTQCGKEFGTRQLLKKHWMWHTGERSHVCPHCNKAFFQKGHLTQHLMIHSGGRPHECPQCHKTFIFKFDLNRHMKIHQERGFSCLQCGRSFLKQIMLDEHHLKCKGKPSSPVRSLLTPTMKAGLESAFSVKPSPETIVLTQDTIAKMAQKLLIQQQENQRSALTTLLVKQQENILNNNTSDTTQILKKEVGGIGGFDVTTPTLPLNLTCMLCKSQFSNQSAFTLHMYMYHFANQNTNLSIDSTPILNIPSHHHHNLQQTSIGEPMEQTVLGSDSDPATDTSCASSPQKTSPLQLLESSCLEQSSVSPSSSSGASPQPTASESSTTSSCKDCTNSWQRVHDLEQQVLKKDEEFENYRQMTRQVRLLLF
uniref:Zinc finger protein n=1 Tax=Caenorhabditis tropicalis TaxID=1561998 RepID=A0A1I7UM50_9PELO